MIFSYNFIRLLSGSPQYCFNMLLPILISREHPHFAESPNPDSAAGNQLLIEKQAEGRTGALVEISRISPALVFAKVDSVLRAVWFDFGFYGTISKVGSIERTVIGAGFELCM
jgi:hypothetical protein